MNIKNLYVLLLELNKLHCINTTNKDTIRLLGLEATTHNIQLIADYIITLKEVDD